MLLRNKEFTYYLTLKVALITAFISCLQLILQHPLSEYFLLEPYRKKLNKLLIECREKDIGLAFVLENFSVSDNFTKILDELESYDLERLGLDHGDWDDITNTYY